MRISEIYKYPLYINFFYHRQNYCKSLS